MTYQVVILRSAQKSLARLPKTAYERVRDATRALATDPRPSGSKKLVDRNGWRIRAGDYRVIYEIDDSNRLVTILHIGHRSDAYS
jgi:mRNA interferase RelE/StbE